MMRRSVAAQRLIRLRVRRLFCDNEKCDARTFAEQVPEPDGAIRCGNPVLRAMLEAIGLALAGRAGARSAEVLDLPASRSTLLRLGERCRNLQTSSVAVLVSTISRYDAAMSTARSWST
jgi:hypothetical protein